VHHARFLVPVDAAELEEPQGQFPIRAAAGPVDQVVHRAVHGLEVVVLPGLADRAVVVVLRVDVHRREHPVGIPFEVTRGDVQLLLGDVRGVDELVPGRGVLTPRVILQFGAHDSTLRMENR
jgi:hypothetical protein